jgi:hypothetical protein
MCLQRLFQRRRAAKAVKESTAQSSQTTINMQDQAHQQQLQQQTANSIVSTTHTHQSYRSNPNMGEEQSILDVLSRRYALDLDSWDDVKQLVSAQDFSRAMAAARMVLENPDTDLWTDFYCRILIALFTDDEGEIQVRLLSSLPHHKQLTNQPPHSS